MRGQQATSSHRTDGVKQRERCEHVLLAHSTTVRYLLYSTCIVRYSMVLEYSYSTNCTCRTRGAFIQWRFCRIAVAACRAFCAIRSHHHRSRHGADDRCRQKNKMLIPLDALQFGHWCAAAVPYRRYTITTSADTSLVPLLDELPPFRSMRIKSSYGCFGFTDDTDKTCGKTEKAEALHRCHRRRFHTHRSHTLCHFK